MPNALLVTSSVSLDETIGNIDEILVKTSFCFLSSLRKEYAKIIYFSEKNMAFTDFPWMCNMREFLINAF